MNETSIEEATDVTADDGFGPVYVPGIDIDILMDQLGDDAWRAARDVDLAWPDVPFSRYGELKARLDAALNQWLREENYAPTFRVAADETAKQEVK